MTDKQIKAITKATNTKYKLIKYLNDPDRHQFSIKDNKGFYFITGILFIDEGGHGMHPGWLKPLSEILSNPHGFYGEEYKIYQYGKEEPYEELKSYITTGYSINCQQDASKVEQEIFKAILEERNEPQFECKDCGLRYEDNDVNQCVECGNEIKERNEL